MRTIWTMVVALVIVAGLGTVLLAADCEVPSFLVTGKTYQILLESTNLKDAKVTEIDQQSCWIKVAIPDPPYAFWVNLGWVVIIQEAQMPPAQEQAK